MSLLGNTDHPMLPIFMGGPPESGRMGDYVFSQEGICPTCSLIVLCSLTIYPALDQIITQIMDSSNAHRPVPATEDAVQKLPREILEEGSAHTTLQLLQTLVI